MADQPAPREVVLSEAQWGALMNRLDLIVQHLAPPDGNGGAPPPPRRSSSGGRSRSRGSGGQQGEYDKLPEGQHHVKLSKGEVRDSRKGDPMVMIVFADPDSPATAAKFQVIPTDGDPEWKFGQFNDLMNALGIDPNLDDADIHQALTRLRGSRWLINVAETKNPDFPKVEVLCRDDSPADGGPDDRQGRSATRPTQPTPGYDPDEEPF